MIRALDHLREQHLRSEHIRRCAAYHRKRRHRMDHAGLRAAGLPACRPAGLPIGSGLVEATCKSLVAQRLRLSGIRIATWVGLVWLARVIDAFSRHHRVARG